MKWRVVLAIAQKDIVDAVKNLYILFSLVMPIGFSLLFGLIMPKSSEVSVLSIVVHDPGRSRLVAELRQEPEVEMLEAASAEQLPAEVERKATGGLIVPLGFDAALQGGQRPELILYTNQRRNPGMLPVFRSMVQEHLHSMAGQELPARITLNQLAMPSSPLMQGGIDLQGYLFVLLLVMALAMTGSFVVPLLLVEEKDKHTLEALLVSPAGPAEIAAAKALTGLFYSTLIAAVLFLLNAGFSGNWPFTIAATLLGALFIIAMGLLLGGLARTTTQVNTWSSVVMLVLMLPSFFTIMEIPDVLKMPLRLIPTTYLVQVVSQALAGRANLAGTWSSLAVLAGSALVTLGGVVWTLRRESK